MGTGDLLYSSEFFEVSPEFLTITNNTASTVSLKQYGTYFPIHNDVDSKKPLKEMSLQEIVDSEVEKLR